MLVAFNIGGQPAGSNQCRRRRAFRLATFDGFTRHLDFVGGHKTKIAIQAGISNDFAPPLRLRDDDFSTASAFRFVQFDPQYPANFFVFVVFSNAARGNPPALCFEEDADPLAVVRAEIHASNSQPVAVLPIPVRATRQFDEYRRSDKLKPSESLAYGGQLSKSPQESVGGPSVLKQPDF